MTLPNRRTHVYALGMFALALLFGTEGGAGYLLGRLVAGYLMVIVAQVLVRGAQRLGGRVVARVT